MAALKKTIKLGILAEDMSDVDVMAILLRRMSPNINVGVKHFVGHGCGKLRNKCRDWAAQLAHRGCSILILIHDLDRRNLADLKCELENAICPTPIKRHLIVIPVEELEAWMMCDPVALKNVFSLKKDPKCPHNPEMIRNPKERLGDLIWTASDKNRRYLHTVHNAKIADKVVLTSLRKCKAYQNLENFWSDVKSA